MGGFEVLTAAYEVSTVVTDVILNSEYIQRKWIEEYILSIAFLVFSGLVMGFVGVALETKLPNRYSRVKGVNTLIAFSLGVVQLRVLVETLYVVLTSRQVKKSVTNQPAQLHQPPGQNHTNTTANTSAATTTTTQSELSVKKLKDGLKFAAFVQAIVRDIPIFIIQANATIHYRKWEFLDLWAVTSTGLTLLHGVADYICKKDTGALRYASSLFIFGQFVMRAGAILLVATTTGHLVVFYALAIAFTSIASSVALKIAHTSPKCSVQLTRALLFFPFFTLFVVNASQLTSRRGSARKSLMGRKLWFVHGWRFVESAIGVALAVFRPRYTDFGVSTDGQIAMIGGICGGVFLVSLAIFLCVASSSSLSKKQSSSIDETEEDSVAAMQTANGHIPNAAYSSMVQLT